MELIYRFDTNEMPELVKVGGKANSLILMTKYGLPVPTGFVLSVEFFKPWYDELKGTTEWQRVINSSPKELKMHTDALKSAEALKLSGCLEQANQVLDLTIEDLENVIADTSGKPCVSGIEDAVSILKDGQMVEMDGLNGTIKLV